jgi:hypothetical protein
VSDTLCSHEPWDMPSTPLLVVSTKESLVVLLRLPMLITCSMLLTDDEDTIDVRVLMIVVHHMVQGAAGKLHHSESRKSF